MECYICHKWIERHDYTRHVGSHSPEVFREQSYKDAGIQKHRPQSPHASETFPDFSYDKIDYEYDEDNNILSPPPSNDKLHSGGLDGFFAHSGRARYYRSPTNGLVIHDRGPIQETRGSQPDEEDAFHLWLQNPTCDFQGYTTVDGQKSHSDLRADKFIQAAHILRGTTRENVVKIVKEFWSLSDNQRETCLGLVRKVPIFPGLVAYTYTHLIMCSRGGRFSTDDWLDRVSDLQQSVERWTQNGDIRCILSCHIIKKRLDEFLHNTKISSKEHKCNPALVNGTIVLKCDILNLAALVALSVTGPQKNIILEQRGGQAEKLVELFHDLLEANIEFDEWYRRCFFNALILLSKETGYCPRSIYLEQGVVGDLVPVSQGGFGFVFKGKVGSRLVAVKAIRGDDSTSVLEYKKQLSKEAIAWRHLRHPNCLPLYGIYDIPTGGPNITVALVSPWMEHGTLLQYLESNPKADRIKLATKLLLDVARGLDYMHSMQPHVAHRDIKPDNILITRTGRACLADFGLVSAFDTDDRFQTATEHIVMGGTCNYMAPEMFKAVDDAAMRKVNKRACDMYALGCTIYAAYTSRHPFHGMRPGMVQIKVMANRRPQLPESMPLDMRNFVENLWSQDPSKRLTATMALDWMKVKARQEGVETSTGSLEEEWEWRGPKDDKSLWTVYI